MRYLQGDSPAPAPRAARETPVGDRRADSVDDMIGMGYFPDEVGLRNVGGEPLSSDRPA